MTGRDPLVVRRLDPTSDTDLEAAYRIVVADERLTRRAWVPEARRSYDALLRHQDPGEAGEHYLVSAQGHPVALVRLWIPLLSNTDRVWAEAFLDPAVLPSGAGWSAVAPLVIDLAAQVARERHRTFVVWEVRAPEGGNYVHPLPALLVAAGATLTFREYVRVLTVPVAPAVLEPLEAAVQASVGDDYTVALCAGEIPSHLRSGYLDLLALIDVDAPTGDLDYEPEVTSVERLENLYSLDRARGSTRLHALAIHRETGVPVAFSDVVVQADKHHIAFQSGTYVHRDHRGHKLGLAVKIANLRNLERDFPHVTEIRTSNDEDNGPMVGINIALGFDIIESAAGYQLGV